MASAEDRFNAAYERTRNLEKEIKQPDSNQTYSTHECTCVWPSREVGSQQRPSLAYNGTHTMAKRGAHAGGIWATIVRGCAAR